MVGITLFEVGRSGSIAPRPFFFRDAAIMICVARAKDLASDKVTRFVPRQLPVVIRVGHFEAAFAGARRSLGWLQILIRRAAHEQQQRDRRELPVKISFQDAVLA